MGVYIGLDIGGTKLLVGAADERGQLLRQAQARTPRGLAEGLELLHTLTAQVAEGETILGFGAAAGGPLDYRSGMVSPLHQPEWNEVPLKALFEARYHCPLVVDVDTNVAALGEYTFGGEPIRRLLYLTISTGVGGGFIVDGELYRGSDGAHPEAGHQGVAYRCSHPERISCICGGGDCLEALVSGNGIERIYGKPAAALSAEEWAEVAYNLGQGLRNLATLYVPDAIHLGGGVAVGAGAPFIQAARAVMARHLRIVPLPAVRLSRLGYHTALMGAIALAMRAAPTS